MHVRQRFATILALVLALSSLVFLLKHQQVYLIALYDVF